MNIIITMAGEGSRFRKIGINKPKHEIIAKNKTLFEWSIISLKYFFDNSSFIFITRTGTKDFIIKKAEELGIKQIQVIEITHLTRGQAETTMLALEHCHNDDGILIFNIDTHLNVSASDLKPLQMRQYDGWLQTFKAPGDHWSFAAVDKENKVIAVTEKKRISDFASTGLYYFKSASLFKRLFEQYSENIFSAYGEIYIAPLYQYLINEKGSVGHSCIDFNKVIALGTPQEVARFDENFLLNSKET